MTPSVRKRPHELRRQWRIARQRHPRPLFAAVGFFLLLAIVPLSGGIWLLMLGRELPDEKAVSHIGEMDQTTALYDDADELAFTIFKEQRLEVPLSDISPNLLHALMAIEDQRFYDHQGVDPVRIVSAAIANVRHGRRTQGASTITQQLARQSFLTPDKTYRRKIQEALLATRIERMYTKPQILELYLNKVYFGDGLYGVEAASRGYFGKRSSELSVAEAALLAGLVKSPSSYAPTVNMERARLRRNMVLHAMLENGDIDRPTWQEARAKKVVLKDALRAQEPHGQYFKEQVRRELLDRFGWQRVYQSGLRVFCTINMDMQVAAERAVAESLSALDEKRRALADRRRLAGKGKSAPAAASTPPLQAALVALDPKTGHVRAMIGGRDFGESRFNRAVQAKRQPGSAFKPFVYAAALEAGYSPATVIDHLDEPVGTAGWAPGDGHSTAGAMTLRTGLRTSSNRAAVRLLQQIGVPRAIEYAKTMGVGNLPNVPSLALGSGEVTVLSMTAAYAAFANRGLVPKPTLIRRVEDRDGTVLYQSPDVPTRAISESTAFMMASMMADVINAGTGARVRRLGFTLPAAGKTGTTNDFNDAWFIGFTPKLVTGVWVGFDQRRTIMANGFAAEVAVPLWATFMKAATSNDKPEWFTPPPGVISLTVCRLSGKLVSEGCADVEVMNRDGVAERRSMVYTEFFERGTEPVNVCEMHPLRTVFEQIAGLVGSSEEPAPAPRGEPLGGLPPAPGPPPTTIVGAVGTAGVQPSEGTIHGGTLDVPPKAEVSRPGFWSRVFGGGKPKDSPPKPDTIENPPPRKKGG